jgi:protein SCO1/2
MSAISTSRYRSVLPILLVMAALSVSSVGWAAADNGVNLEQFRMAVTVPAVTLIDQQGKAQPLQNVFKDKVVVVDFVFTSCRSVCPIITAVMKRIQQLLAEHLGDSVVLVSISLQPEQDTPEKLAQFSGQFGNSPHWLWLTGTAAEVAQALSAFGINPSAAAETHPPLVFVGRGNDWFKWVGLPDAQQVAQAALALSNQQVTP